MSKQAFKRLRKSVGLEVGRQPLPAFAWPGGYPLFYLFTDGGCICPSCVNKHITEIDLANREKYQYPAGSRGGWAIDAVDTNYEDPDLYCDQCGGRIESAYAEPEGAK